MKLYYLYINVPSKVHIVSKKLMLDYILFPEGTGDVPLGLDDLFKLLNSEYIDRIDVFLTEDNMAYIRDENNANEKVPIKGWVDLSRFSDGGDVSTDPLSIEEVIESLPKPI